MYRFVNYLLPQKNFFLLLTLLTFLYYGDAFSGEFEPGGKAHIETVNPAAEVLLGAVVNVRKRGGGLFGCGERRNDGLTTKQALKWTVDQVNKKIWSSSSSNISIGVQIMDSCSRMRIATSQLTEFFPELKGNTISGNANNLQYKLGIIDDVGLENEIDVSNTLEELNIPIIKTDIDIISPQGISTAALNAIQELRWNHIALVHGNSRNSLSMLKTFIKSFKKFDLCVPWIINIESSSAQNDREDLQAMLNSRLPIVSLLSSEKHHFLLSRVKDVKKQRHKIPILFTDLIKREDLKGVPANAISLFALVPLPEKDAGFEEYFWRNSTVAEMRGEDDLELMERTKTLRKMQAILDKLSATLTNLMRDFCENYIHMCQDLTAPAGRIAAFHQINEHDWSVDYPLYGLMEYQFRKPEGHILLHKVLTYNKFKNVDVFEQNLPYVEVSCENDSKILRPECNCIEGKSMRRGAARNIDSNRKQTEDKEYYHTEVATAESPVKKRLEHFPRIATAFSSFRDPINAILACLILLGAFFTLFTGQYFATFAARPRGGLTSGTSVIGYFILLGLFFLYITNMSFILTPSVVTCTIRRFGTSASYAVIFSGMMIKVWSAWKETRSEKAERWKPSTLIILSLSFALLQILFSGLWLIFVPPRIHFDPDRWMCYPSGDLDSHLLVSMIYIIGILLATAVLAIQTSAKNNNDETRWILISSALVAVLFSCWGISIATGVWQNQRTAIFNLVSATILLSCLYIPKIRAHSKLKKLEGTGASPTSVKLVDEFSGFTALPPYPLILDCNVTPPPPSSSEDISDSSYSNQGYSMDGASETISAPFDIDASSTSDIGPEPLTFSTFFNDIRPLDVTGNTLDGDPTQVVPSTLYPLDMFNNEEMSDDKDHYEPGTNEFTPQHRISSQLYLYPPPEWVP